MNHIDVMKQALDDMKLIAENMECWALYSGDYFTDKHNLNSDITHAMESIEKFSKAIAEAEKQDPVVYAVPDFLEVLDEMYGYTLVSQTKSELHNLPLYTAPPQREWVGLTDEDLSVCDADGVQLARYWERILKEKNT